MRVALHTDARLLPDDFPAVPLLAPFLRPGQESPLLSDFERVASDHYRLTSLEQAAFAVYPLDYRFAWKAPERLAAFRRFNEAAARRGVPTLLFFTHDVESPAQITHGWVLRPSMSRSTRRPEEICTPGWAEDLLEQHRGGTISILRRSQVPSVGFCGCVHGGYGGHYRLSQRWRWLKARLAHRWMGRPYGRLIRRLVIERLEGDPRVRSRVIARPEYFGDIAQQQPGMKERLKSEFVSNLLENDYALCMRGAGNYSKRFYETMACGRIPLIIDTDLVLPREDIIDYRSHCVWVPGDDLDGMVSRLLAFHEGLDAEAFADRQRWCRRQWVDHLSPRGFLTQLPGIIRSSEKL